MRSAYDTILSDCVNADTAAKCGGGEPYRYECACCWEEERLCAADSQNQATPSGIAVGITMLNVKTICVIAVQLSAMPYLTGMFETKSSSTFQA